MSWLKNLFGIGSRKAETANLATLKKEAGNVYVLCIGGVLNKATVDRIQAIGASEIERGTKELKVLIILNDFKGWKKGDRWGDIDFFASHGDDIAKIAAVGEPMWRDNMMLFLLAGRRKGEVRYFLQDQEAQARAWLAS